MAITKQTRLIHGFSKDSIILCPDCGCNVFTEHSEPLQYVCNVCGYTITVKHLWGCHAKDNQQSELLRV